MKLLAVFDSSIEVDRFSGFYFDNAEPITRAEFDAALDARFAAIKAMLPEVK